MTVVGEIAAVAERGGTSSSALVIRRLGLCDYQQIWHEMREFTAARDAETADEIWLLQHPAVFTQGTRDADAPTGYGEIPVVKSDRGGLTTYHAPGQIIAYLLLDLRRRGGGAKSLVAGLEGVLIDLLGDYGIAADRRPGAPGVYVGAAKIAALGLRVKRGCTYHGASLNVAMDLRPYAAIAPCGFAGLPVTQMTEYAAVEIGEVETRLARRLAKEFG